MTTMDRYEVNCGVCNEDTEVTMITSTNSMGSPDLDTRPAPMRRYNLGAEINRCPHCGYCCINLETATKSDIDLVGQEEYQSQLTNPDFPEIANSYLCYALLNDASNDSENHFWSMLSAAWACDDEGAEEAASSCRLRAADIGLLCIEKGISFGGDRDSEVAIIVDALRRAKDFSRADALLTEHDGQCENETVEVVLNFQRLLVTKKDFQLYRIQEAFEQADQ